MNNDPRSPFNWKMRTEPSIFYKDPYFRTRNSGKTISQQATETLDKRREVDPLIGTMKNMGRGSALKKEEERMLAYRQFGVYSKAQPGKKSNKHEGTK